MDKVPQSPPELDPAPHTEAALAGAARQVADAVVGYLEERRRAERRTDRWRRMRRGAVVAVGLIIAFVYVKVTLLPGDRGRLGALSSSSTVAIIPVHGAITARGSAGADAVVPLIEKACRNGKVAAIILDIDSGGGSPVDAERIGQALGRCRAEGEPRKPIHSLIGAMGSSAAYMIAMRADDVSASHYSVVGSVGAIMRNMDASEAAQRLGVSEWTVRSGPLKGGASLLSPPDEGQTQILAGLVDDLGQRFLEEVIAARGTRLKASREDLASGRVWSAGDALALGLIDEIAVLEDLKERYRDHLFVVYRGPTPLAKSLGIESVLRSIATELAQPRIE